MAYTDNSDLYGAVHEDGVNTVIRHMRRKRPSLFNYGTERIIEASEYGESIRPSLAAAHERGVLCADIQAADEVREWDNSLLSEVDPLPVLGTDGMVKLDYCFQVADMSIDFSPDDPPADVGEQQFAATVVVCAGLACPREEEFDRVRNEVTRIRREHGTDLSDGMREELGLPIVPQPGSLNCFCLEVTVVGSVGSSGPGVEGPWLSIPETPELSVDELIFGTEEEELGMPKGMTRSITCYIRSFIEFSLLPKLNEALGSLTPQLPADSLLAIEFSETRATVSLPTSSSIPNNPALEDDQLKVYADIDMTIPGGS